MHTFIQPLTSILYEPTMYSVILNGGQLGLAGGRIHLVGNLVARYLTDIFGQYCSMTTVVLLLVDRGLGDAMVDSKQMITRLIQELCLVCKQWGCLPT